jgi:ribosomal protein S18 acetylase RimI-like enzyme
MIDVTELEHKLYEVNRVSVPNTVDRGKGIARKLMEELLADVDREGVTLQLYINPSGGGMSYYALAAWYNRCGFLFVGEKYVRYPMNSRVRLK